MTTKSTIDIAHNLIQHDKTKHIKIDRHFIKEKLDGGLLTIVYVPSGYQLANVLSKRPYTESFQDRTSKLKMIDIHS